ncbi:MAG: VCBS repeat-containing protein [Candidatus Heimdallarchaeum endolithica]|uniref:VCBS repeat-containing protein n=1 Tax=Candidatus Heimdallarchaeum endolithica TaxID=2876572 RepID=A0A9Y1BR81_9ARCH|nr:MAG: VCBS repeat-containing protein [Candidatus Heimdallarchaeum endolithica]
MDKDKIPEIITLSDVNGQVQDRDEPGYTKFLEYNKTTRTFSNDLLSISTTGPTLYYPVEAYTDNEAYLLEKTYSDNYLDNIFIWKKWNGTGLVNVSSDTYIKNDGLYDCDSYDFDLDGNVDLVCNWGYYSGVWTRLELENGFFSSTDYSFYNGGRSIFVSDLDNDGNPNVAVLYVFGRIKIYNYNPSIDDFQFQQEISRINDLKVIYPWNYDKNEYSNIIVVSTPSEAIIYSYCSCFSFWSCYYGGTSFSIYSTEIVPFSYFCNFFLFTFYYLRLFPTFFVNFFFF